MINIMELNINDPYVYDATDFDLDFVSGSGSEIDLTKINFDIPMDNTAIVENKINVIKQKEPNIKAVPKPILKKNMNMNPQQKTQKRVSYDDILSKMGMCVTDGKLQKISCNEQKCAREVIREYNSKPQAQQLQQSKSVQPVNINPNLEKQNSYIYNKYFKDEIRPQVQPVTPKTPQEYNQIFH